MVLFGRYCSQLISGRVSLKLYSKEAGIVNKHFLEELINSTYSWQVRNDLNEGIEKGVRDVPAFFVNGEMVAGKATYENLSKNINAALKKVNMQLNKKTKCSLHTRIKNTA